MRLSLIAIVLLLIWSRGDTQALRLSSNPDPDNLILQLLEAYVDRSELFSGINYLGEFEYSAAVQMLKGDEIDALWTAADPVAEEELRAVYVPIYRGTLGYRLAIVEQEKVNILREVRSVSDLQKMWVCQGKLWSDTLILEANGLTVAKSLKYPPLFRMLEADRCEYFPRGMFEPWAELETHKELNLTVDSHLLIRYTNPYLYYVRRENAEMAADMEAVFGAMYDDGTFQETFFSNGAVQDALEKSRLGQRRILDLDNPFVSDAIRNIPKRYWYEPSDAAD